MNLRRRDANQAARRPGSTRASWRRAVGGDRNNFDSPDKEQKTLERNPRSPPSGSGGEPERARPLRTAGNLAVQRLLRSGVLQAKLAVGQPGDPFEREADRAAERVVAARAVAPSLQLKCACGGGVAGGECEECRMKAEAGARTDGDSAAPARSVVLPSGRGRPL